VGDRWKREVGLIREGGTKGKMEGESGEIERERGTEEEAGDRNGVGMRV
jgi:hypothetical protein